MCVTEAIGKYNEEENMGYFLAQQKVAMFTTGGLKTSKQIRYVREVFRRAGSWSEGEVVACIHLVSNSPNHTVFMGER